MFAAVFFGSWLLAVFLCYLAWVAAGTYCGRYRWALRAIAIALLVRPVLVGFAPCSAALGLIVYGWDVWELNQNDMYPEFIRCVKAVGYTAPIVWIALELGSRANKHAKIHEQQNPLLNNKK